MARPAALALSIALLAPSVLGGCRSEPPPIEAEPAQAQPGMATLPKRLQAELPLAPFAALKLEAVLAEPSPIEAGAPIPIEARLVNVSQEPVPVVQVGDGSSVGWREPHLFFTVEHAGVDGVFRPAPEESFGRCGNYDDDWTDEVTVLDPGKSLSLDYFLSPDTFFDLNEPGEARIRVHYRYQRGMGRKSQVAAPPSMASIPAFELVSAPVSVTLERRFEVTLEAKRSVGSQVPVSLDEVFELRVRNVTDTERSLVTTVGGTHGQANIWFEVKPNDRYLPNVSRRFADEDPRHRLAPGAEAVVLGEESVLGASNEGWTPEQPGEIEVRATYRYARSEWVTVTIR